jgi:putative ABC transport system permease protein
MQYNEITAENVHTFHFHGDPAKFPLTAAIVLPRDERSATLLVGRFSLPDAPLQLVTPTTVIGHLMDTVFAVRRYLLAAALLVNLATLIAVGLIFALTVRLRRREIETLVKLGASPWRIRAILGCELLLVLCIAAVTAGALAWLSTSSSTILLRLILRS